MNIEKPLCIGLALACSWLTRSGWRRSDSAIEEIFFTDLYTDMARKAEQAKLDFLFRPDTLFLAPEAVAREPGFSSLDPFILLSALARETQHIGLVATASTTFLPPYVVARQLQSLNWISRGRAGWNVVTAIDGNQNFGESEMMPSQARYQKAQEFTDLVRQLWQSYPAEALLNDRETGRFADIDKIHPVDHQGDFFSVKGPLNLPAYPKSDIPLFQAGASESGRQFAARIADAIFAATPDMQAGVELREDLRRRAEAQGRSPDSVKVLPGLSLYLAPTRAEAQTLFQETHADQTTARKLAYLQTHLGVDLSDHPMDKPVTADLLPESTGQVRSQTHTDLLRRLITRESPVLAALLQRPEVIGSAHWLVVGTPEDALKEIMLRAEAGAADGFIAVPGGSMASADLFFEALMPMLSDKGLFRKEYSGNTLQDHLNGV